MLASFLSLVPHHHLDEQVDDHKVRVDDFESRLGDYYISIVNKIEFQKYFL